MAAIYVTMLSYSTEGVRGISAARTAEAKEAIKRAGGKFITGYELLGTYDAMIIAEYPDEKAAMKSNIELNKLIGVTSNTMIGVPIDEFDQDLACFL
ncbi:GYD domain-containing protein [candidate division KSB3 bacterium]|uniref:GYD domain-containing protein n=1 Tax=candidate division KSB3 bacterium TaxID=2044937 RepID=A0A9D5JYC7_9BACT|nr:GYD domain-containing protein [candidate division KSB3 bacterium]MBD3325976.1 GYD domain-containing protein [candidate division KSB3 bacterium]